MNGSLGSRRWWIAGGVALVGALALAARPSSPTPAERVAAPELEGGTGWFNSDRPIRIADLRGKVVVLDFWTLCCINCIHTLPDLARLEAKYPNQLVVIGVHSGKFDNEKDPASIRSAIRRYEVRHPVVNDADQKIWQAYGVRSWPSLYLVDPEGFVVARGEGEGLYDTLDAAIADLIRVHRGKGTLDERPRRFTTKQAPDSDSTLLFPGKILADADGGRLFIADSTHHRIVITNREGRRIAVAGSGRAGRADGPFDAAEFNEPQGMALAGETLYVADRKNHLIRALDLKKLDVRTVAGTGTQGRGQTDGGPALKTGLNSPWDLLIRGNRLYVAVAGNHQIWILDLTQGQLRPFAGNGREDIVDGPPARASFAQPSGLATDGEILYVADSEDSAVRRVRLDGDGQVKTLVGKGLFEFGDRDGRGDAVRLQHPLGIACNDGKLYVADTYNSKIKQLDPGTRDCATFLDSSTVPGGLHEPAGLSIADGKLFIADTNANRIVVVDLKSKAASVLPLSDVAAPAAVKAGK